MNHPHTTTTAIIGAGLAATSLTHQLQASGHTVTLIEKSRGSGGRLASCRLVCDDPDYDGDQDRENKPRNHNQPAQFSADLGAPCFRASDPQFIEWLEQQPELQRWQPDRGQLARTPDTRPATAQTPVAPPQPATNARSDCQSDCQSVTVGLETDGKASYWTAAPRLSALTRRLSNAAELRTSTRVASVCASRDRQQWQLYDPLGELIGSYDQVVITAPAPQAAQLLAQAHPEFAERAATVIPAPRWVLVLALSPGTLRNAPPLLTGEHPLVARVVCDSAKPGRQSQASLWVIEARQDWSQVHCDTASDSVHRQLLQAFTDIMAPYLSASTSVPHAVRGSRVHRWLYASHPHPLPEPCLWQAANLSGPAIGVCGDWLGSDGADDLAVERSWKSARALAAQMLASTSVRCPNQHT